MAIAAKLIRVFYAMLTKGVDYDLKKMVSVLFVIPGVNEYSKDCGCNPEVNNQKSNRKKIRLLFRVFLHIIYLIKPKRRRLICVKQED